MVWMCICCFVFVGSLGFMVTLRVWDAGEGEKKVVSRNVGYFVLVGFVLFGGIVKRNDE